MWLGLCFLTYHHFSIHLTQIINGPLTNQIAAINLYTTSHDWMQIMEITEVEEHSSAIGDAKVVMHKKAQELKLNISVVVGKFAFFFGLKVWKSWLWMQLHGEMCKTLSAIYCKVLGIFPVLEAARPRSTTGIQALCSLHIALEKTKNILQHCAGCSKLYLVWCLYFGIIMFCYALVTSCRLVALIMRSHRHWLFICWSFLLLIEWPCVKNFQWHCHSIVT